jgi:hypothetical protein
MGDGATLGSGVPKVKSQPGMLALVALVRFPESGQRSAFPAWGKVQADGDRMAQDECGGIRANWPGAADGTASALDGIGCLHYLFY